MGSYVQRFLGGALSRSTPPPARPGRSFRQVTTVMCEDAVAAAAEAFPAWSSMPAATRAYHLQQVGRVFVEHGEELARLETRDNGRLLDENRIRAGVGMAFTWNRAGRGHLGGGHGRSVVLDSGTIGITRREPYGVVAAVIPGMRRSAMSLEQGFACPRCGQHGRREAGRTGVRVGVALR